MLSQLDHILFPDRCEVYEVVPSQRYVYSIYKNGSSSLMMCSRSQGWRVFLNERIRNLNQIDIILREPATRFISGLNIYVQQVMKNNPNLDRETVIWFAKNYLYLNRHYCPQFLWIVNLARYLNPDAALRFYNMLELNNIVDDNYKPLGYVDVTPEFAESVGTVADNEMYQRIDQSLIDCCMDQCLTWKQTLEAVKNRDPVAYEHVVVRAQKILQSLDVLRQT